MTLWNRTAASSAGIAEEWVSVGGDQIPYLRAGESGPAIVLAHGAGGTRRDWMKNLPYLATRYRVYAPDLIGFGDSPQQEEPLTLSRLSDFLLDFMAAVELDSAALVGHSLGGRVCLEAALMDGSKASALVLVAPLGFGKLSRTGRALGFMSWGLARVGKIRPPYPDLDFSGVKSDRETFDPIRCPTLLLWGSRDLYFPHEQATRAMRSIPNARLKVYRGMGHAPHRAAPVQFASDVISFLEGRP